MVNTQFQKSHKKLITNSFKTLTSIYLSQLFNIHSWSRLTGSQHSLFHKKIISHSCSRLTVDQDSQLLKTHSFTNLTQKLSLPVSQHTHTSIYLSQLFNSHSFTNITNIYHSKFDNNLFLTVVQHSHVIKTLSCSTLTVSQISQKNYLPQFHTTIDHSCFSLTVGQHSVLKISQRFITHNFTKITVIYLLQMFDTPSRSALTVSQISQKNYHSGFHKTNINLIFKVVRRSQLINTHSFTNLTKIYYSVSQN